MIAVAALSVGRNTHVSARQGGMQGPAAVPHKFGQWARRQLQIGVYPIGKPDLQAASVFRCSWVAITATTDVAAHDFLCMQLLLLPCYQAGFRRLSCMQGPAFGLHNLVRLLKVNHKWAHTQ